jgi:hypothetical protein
MTDYSNRTKHDVFMGQRVEGALLTPKQVGYALQFEGTDYFVLKFWERPQVTYYISKNRDSDTNYTVFAKRIEEETRIKFQNPVGSAQLKPDLKTHLELQLPFSRLRAFMSLFPA